MSVEAVFTFANTHHAILAERALLDDGLPVKVMPLPAAIQAGCGLCLRLPLQECAAAEEIMNRRDIQWQQCYRRVAEGNGSLYTAMEKEDG